MQRYYFFSDFQQECEGVRRFFISINKRGSGLLAFLELLVFLEVLAFLALLDKLERLDML